MYVCVYMHMYFVHTYRWKKTHWKELTLQLLAPSKSQDVHLVTGNPEELVVKL